MSISTELLDIKKKNTALSNTRHEIKKKRFILDEGKERFGMDEFSQLIKVKNTSEVKGYPFKISKSSDNEKTKGLRLVLKVVPVESKYDKNEHPCYLENIVLKELTDNIVLKNISPHITFYLGTQKVANKSRALKQLNLKRLEVEEKIRSHANMLISEYVEGGSLDNWIFTTYENDQEITDEQWRSIIFQLVYTIAIIQHYYRMMHNDFHYGNILIDNKIKAGGYFVYTIGSKRYYLKNTGVIPKLWDFEFSMVYSDKIKECYPNKFITGPYQYDKKKHIVVVNDEDQDDDYNVPYNYNEVYDLHYFLTSLLDLYISQELFDWIKDIYPDELIPDEETSSSRSHSTSQESSRSRSPSHTHSSSPSHSPSNSSSPSQSSLHGSSLESSIGSSATYQSSHTDDTDSSNSTYIKKRYLNEGRIINGVEREFDLPTPLSILKHKFFEGFLEVPPDFDENNAVYFNAGF